MAAWLIQRLAATAGVLLVVSVLGFLLIHPAPADPVLLMLGTDATPDTILELRRQMGLDQPLPVQYLSFVANAVRGDFGRSFITHHPIADDVVRTLPAPFELAIASLGLGVVFGAPAGILAGIHPRSALDRAITFVAALGLSVPVYWIGLMLIFIFAVSLHVLPTSGRGTLAQLLLPSISLSIYVDR